MKNIFVLVFGFMIASNICAQNFTANDLAIRWEIVENYHQNKARFLSAFTLKNTGNKALPSSGWKIFFNLPRMIDTSSVSGQMQITHRNGDFYQLNPSAGFNGLQPGDSLRVEFVGNAWAINITDAPNGLYIVWDDKPAKGILLTNYLIRPSTQPKQYMQSPADKVNLSTPAIVYEQNKNIVDIPHEQLTKIFPTPVTYNETGGVFNLSSDVVIKYEESFKNEASYLLDELAKLLGEKLKSTIAISNEKLIELKKNNLAGEAYQLNVQAGKITIAAGTAHGIFNGIQSLKTLVPSASWKNNQSSIDIPTVEVTDVPRFEHRAFMLDVARNFQSKQEVFKVLDLMSLYKLNVFHFHLNDDEGWRLEIPGLPELTAVGARRGHSLDNKNFLQPSFGSGPDLNSFGSGFYTKQDFIDILKYAKRRHIRVIPEIETPGHARAAIVSMRARYERLLKEGKEKEATEFLLQDINDKSVYRSVQRWSDNVMDVALPSTYRFLEKVVDEMRAMYKAADAPLQMIHFGGDEVPAGVWERSPAAQKLMKENKTVKNTNDLWYYFFGRVNDLLKKRNLFLYGWEEIAMRKTKLDNRSIYIPNPDLSAKNVHTDVWNNVIGWGAEDLPYQLANAGYKVILSPVSNMYFDLAYEKALDEPGYYWGGYLDVDKPFYFIPFDYYKNSTKDISGKTLSSSFFNNKERLTDYGKENIPGIQGLLWGETLKNTDRLEYMLLPKLLGLAERAWAKDPAWATEKDSAKASQLYNHAWSQFVNIIGKRELPRLDHYAGGFKYRIPTAGAVITEGKLLVNTQIPGFTARYTTDGTDPVITSPVYDSSIPLKGNIRLRLFNSTGRGGRVVEIEKTSTL